MNKFIKLTITFLMVFAVAGCGSSEESIKLETQTVNGVKIAVPTDMPSFKKNDDGDKESQDKDNTASITVSNVEDAGGDTPSDIDESFIDDMGKDLKNFKILEFDTDKKINDVDTVYAKVSGKNDNKANIVMDIYLFFYADGTAQSVMIVYSKGNNTSLEKNIKKINKSITVKQTESVTQDTQTEEEITVFPLKIENQSGSEIEGLYCSTADTNNWEEDLLNSILYDGDSFTVNFHLNENNDLVWDFRLVLSSYSSAYFYNIDFTGCPRSGTTMTITTNEQDYLITLNGKTYTADDYD